MVLVGLGSLQLAVAQPPTTKSEQLATILRMRPIETHSEAVRKVLGDPRTKDPDFYEFEGFNLLISYARGLPCDPDCVKKNEYCGWSVPRDTLITLVITIKESFHQKDLQKYGIDLGQFKRIDNADHVPGITHFRNEEDGIGIVVNGYQVASISLFPARKYYHLMCAQTKEKCRTQ